jgi:hypothetical protein
MTRFSALRSFGLVGALSSLLAAFAPPDATETTPVAVEGSAATDVVAASTAQPAVAQTVDVVVRVERLAGDFAAAPLADAPVRLHIVVQPHQVIETREGTTDASGRVAFTVPVTAGAEAVAEVTDGSRRFADPISLSEPGLREVVIQSWATTSDPSVVFVSRLVTIVQPSENYLVVQQVYSFAVDQPVIYRPDLSDPGPGMAARMVRVALPEGAAGVQIIRPAEQVRHLGDALFFGGEVAPAGMGERGPSLVVQYSLKHNNAESFVFEQALTLDTESISFVVPRLTGLSRHPILDVTLDVPLCAEPVSGTVCFEEITNDTSGMAIDPTAQVLVARGGRGSAGDVVRIGTDGWPSRPNYPAFGAGLLGALALLFGLVLVRRELRLAPTAVDPQVRRLQALEAQRVRLIAEAQALEEAYARGEVLRHQYEARRAAIEEQLAVVFRGLRESASVAS